MHGVKLPHPLGRRSYSFAPLGFHAFPESDETLAASVQDLVGQLKTLRSVGFRWNVRYDHAYLAEQLYRQNVPCDETSTQVVALTTDYEAVFSSYNATIRNQVRRAKREGVVVKEAKDKPSLSSYFDIYKAYAQRQHWQGQDYTFEQFSKLLTLGDELIFLTALLDNKIIAGGIFFKDGNSLLYWHGAMDREFSNYFPTCAVIDHAIQIGCSAGFQNFNMGGSIGKGSLAQFKSYWGSQEKKIWKFSWQNPLWQTIGRSKALVKRKLSNWMRGNSPKMQKVHNFSRAKIAENDLKTHA